MATGPRYRVHFRRRREGKTDYRTRKKLISSGLPRAVVRCSSKYTTVQIIGFDMRGDTVLAAATSKELKDLGWTLSAANTPAAYLAGLLAGKRATEKKIESAVLDIGLRVPGKGTKAFAAMKGLIDAGIEIPHDAEEEPDESRIKGEHIGDEAPKMFEGVASKIRGGQ